MTPRDKSSRTPQGSRFHPLDFQTKGGPNGDSTPHSISYRCRRSFPRPLQRPQSAFTHPIAPSNSNRGARGPIYHRYYNQARPNLGRPDRNDVAPGQENNKTSGKVKEGRVHRLRPSILDPKYREKVKDLFTEGQDLKRSMEEYLTKVERVIGCSADDMEWDMTNVKIIMRDADLKGNSSTRVFMSETGGRSPDEKPEGRNGGRNAPNEAKVQSATTMKMDEE